MVWATTIATFLGTVITALLLYFVFSRRERILKMLKEQRAEERIAAEVSLGLASLDEPLSYEKVLTENASRHGARVVAKKPWRPNDRVLVRSPLGEERARARIAYCSALPGGAFVVGLQFSLGIDEWVPSRSEVSDHPFPGHPYRK